MMISRISTLGFLFAVGCVSSFGSSASGQEGIARIVYLQDVDDDPKQGLADAVQKLKEQTEQLRKTMSTPSLDSGSPAMESQGPQIGPRLPGEANTSATSPEQQVRLKTIEKNIGLLRKLYSENNRRQVPPANNGTHGSIPGSQSRTQQRPTPQLTAAQANDFMEKASEGQMPKAGVTNQPTIVATQVVPGIVDSFELGNSLFISGEIPAALVAYNNVDRTKLSMFDRTWLEILVGCCHRRLGQYELAEASYDEVVSAKNGVRSAKIAEDWLAYIAKRQRTNAAVETAGASADKLLQQAETFLNEYQTKN